MYQAVRTNFEIVRKKMDTKTPIHDKKSVADPGFGQGGPIGWGAQL